MPRLDSLNQSDSAGTVALAVTDAGLRIVGVSESESFKFKLSRQWLSLSLG